MKFVYLFLQRVEAAVSSLCFDAFVIPKKIDAESIGGDIAIPFVWAFAPSSPPAITTAFASWVTIPPDAGAQAVAGGLTVSVLENTTGAERTATISVEFFGAKKTVEIVQKSETIVAG